MASGRQPNTSAKRWLILRALADADRPLDCGDLLRLTGVVAGTARSLLQRPITARWVAATPATPRGRRYGQRTVYEITAVGRAYLAAHTTTAEESRP
jgi:DNA-binding IclR family transcriptional regulator